MAACLIAAPAARDQQATFRASVDLIAVEVQVVDRDGTPIRGLVPGQFEASIDGRRRRVVSADLVQNAPLPAMASETSVADRQPGPLMASASSAPGRVFMLAIDIVSFGSVESRGVAAAARDFIGQLRDNDLVGLQAFPIGPEIRPTTNHAAVARKLDFVIGLRKSIEGEFHLTPVEVIDINAEVASSALHQPPPQQGRGGQPVAALAGNETDTLRRVQLRECESDVRCIERIAQEASALGFILEGQVTESLSGLSALLRGMADYPGRKTVVVISAGMPVADRPGGRPNIGGLAQNVARDAALANATIYALHVDSTVLQTFSAERRKADKMPVSRARDSAVLGRLLDEFADASGGALMRVLVGSGEYALGRILRETSSHYLLGVEPDQADRDGRLRELKVKVSQRGATVRSRTWVVVPKRQ